MKIRFDLLFELTQIDKHVMFSLQMLIQLFHKLESFCTILLLAGEYIRANMIVELMFSQEVFVLELFIAEVTFLCTF